jgi:hypothetical protein
MIQRILSVLGAIRDLASDLFRVLGPCRYSALIVFVGGGAFLVVPQGQDVLRRVVEWGPGSLGSLPRGDGFWAVFHEAVFMLAVLLWAASSWYWARVILHVLMPDQPEDTDPRRTRLREWVPRALGTLALAGMAAALWRAAGSYYAVDADNRGPIARLEILAWTCLVLAAVFLAATIRRRRRIVARAGPQVAAAAAAASAAQVVGIAGLPRVTRRAGLASLGLALALGVVFTLWPIAAGRAGAASILLVTAATWVLFGTGILYLSRLWRVPLLVLLLAAAVLFSFWNDNHAIRLAPSANGRQPAGPDASITASFDAWYRGIEGDNVFLVAAEGGGIRAAYWTALVLGEIDDQQPAFARHVFAISGISGGSLGAAVFDALLAERRERGGTLKCGDAGSSGISSLRGCADAVLRPDFLSPTLAKLIAPDLGQRFLPFPVPLLDRGRTLEDSWAAAWQDAVGSDRFDRPFLELWHGTDQDPPSLVLNATHVESGRRIIASNLHWTSAELVDAYDLLKTLDSDLRLKTAVHCGARFTYISPAGTMRQRRGTKGERAIRGHVVDGGYFESSGVETALQLHGTLVEHRQGLAPRLHVLFLRNSPATLPDLKAIPVPEDEPEARPYPSVNEVLSPPRALLNARDARASLAVAGMRAALGARLIEIGLCDRFTRDGRRRAPLPLPLGWELSESARAAMSEQLDHGCPGADEPGLSNPEKVRAVIGLLPVPAPAAPTAKGAGMK